MGVAWRGEPHVVPVNYHWVGDAVIVRTDANTPLGNAAGRVAVLEIDSVDEKARTGWSVVVRGRCSVLGPDAEAEPDGRARASGTAGVAEPEPWAPGGKERRLRIAADSVTGRLVSVVDPAGDEWWRQSASN
jgi:hypothetical protein